MAGHLLFNSGSNESSLAPQFKWLDNTFKFFACTKLSPACKFAGGIRELHAAPIMLAIYR